MAAKVAVVTGAASGMGKLMAARLANAGWAVAAVDLPGPQLDDVAQETGAEPHPCDVADDVQVTATAQAVLERTGKIDRLVNAAGIARSGRIDDLPASAFERSMNVNYLGTVRWVQAVLPAMRARGAGDVILFASLAGWMPTPAMAAYTSTKFAVVGFAETLAMELAGTGIRLRCVCPAAVQTPMLDDIMAQGISERAEELIAGRGSREGGRRDRGIADSAAHRDICFSRHSGQGAVAGAALLAGIAHRRDPAVLRRRLTGRWRPRLLLFNLVSFIAEDT